MVDAPRVLGRSIHEVLALAVLGPALALPPMGTVAPQLGRAALLLFPLAALAGAVQAVRATGGRRRWAWAAVATVFLLVVLPGVWVNTVPEDPAPGREHMACHRTGVLPHVVAEVLVAGDVLLIPAVGVLAVVGAALAWREGTRVQGLWTLGGVVLALAATAASFFVSGCPAI